MRGTPGVDDLQNARRALAAGDYAHMLQLARTAESQARHAILQAQRRIAQRQREEVRRAEAARRARHSARQSGMRIGSGGSRGAAQSRKLNNSGFSRSGW